MNLEYEDIRRFVQAAVGTATGTAARQALFVAVRDLPYATDAASDALTLVRLRRGNCLAKADLLVQGLELLGYPTRRVRWWYQLPSWPPEVEMLPTRADLHTAVEAALGERWVLVDATHDLPLARGGLTVARWDGEVPTPPAYPPTGPIWREGQDDAAIEAALDQLNAWYEGWRQEADPVVSAAYREAFNAWLERLRLDNRHEVGRYAS